MVAFAFAYIEASKERILEFNKRALYFASHSWCAVDSAVLRLQILVKEYLNGIEPSIGSFGFKVEVAAVSTSSNHSESEEVVISSEDSSSFFSTFPTHIELGSQE